MSNYPPEMMECLLRCGMTQHDRKKKRPKPNSHIDIHFAYTKNSRNTYITRKHIKKNQTKEKV